MGNVTCTGVNVRAPSRGVSTRGHMSIIFSFLFLSWTDLVLHTPRQIPFFGVPNALARECPQTAPMK